jgi:hypothetical protein
MEKRNKYLYGLIILCTFFFFSCRNELKPKEYVNWIKNKQKGLLVEKEKDSYLFRLQFKPEEYMALIETRGENTVDTSFQKVLENYSGMEYYDFMIAVKNSNNEVMKYDIKSPTEYFEKVDYMAFKMQNRFTLIADKDTLPCKLFHFERNYNTSPESHFSLGFEVPKNGVANRKLIYNDEIFGVNEIELEIQGESISKLPKLKYSF